MAVFRVEKTRNYTVMSNHHLKDRDITLKSKGLLSMMLSLPDEWNYTTRGLAAICKEGVDSIGSALRELEAAGYIVRTQLHDERGRMSDTKYVIYEQPQHKPDTAHPGTAPPDTETPYTENPYTVKPCTEKPVQLNTYRSNTHPPNTQIKKTQAANPYPSNPNQSIAAPDETRDAGWDQSGCDEIGCDEAKHHRQMVRENIEYDILSSDPKTDRDRLDEIVELMVETLCSTKPTINVAGDDYPASLVKSKLLRLTSTHIEYVFECMGKNTTYVRNIKKYLLATLFNAPSTIGSYYSALVNHDLYGDGSRGL